MTTSILVLPENGTFPPPPPNLFTAGVGLATHRCVRRHRPQCRIPAGAADTRNFSSSKHYLTVTSHIVVAWSQEALSSRPESRHEELIHHRDDLLRLLRGHSARPDIGRADIGGAGGGAGAIRSNPACRCKEKAYPTAPSAFGALVTLSAGTRPEKVRIAGLHSAPGPPVAYASQLGPSNDRTCAPPEENLHSASR